MIRQHNNNFFGFFSFPIIPTFGESIRRRVGFTQNWRPFTLSIPFTSLSLSLLYPFHLFLSFSLSLSLSLSLYIYISYLSLPLYISLSTFLSLSLFSLSFCLAYLMDVFVLVTLGGPIIFLSTVYGDSIFDLQIHQSSYKHGIGLANKIIMSTPIINIV